MKFLSPWDKVKPFLNLKFAAISVLTMELVLDVSILSLSVFNQLDFLKICPGDEMYDSVPTDRFVSDPMGTIYACLKCFTALLALHGVKIGDPKYLYLQMKVNLFEALATFCTFIFYVYITDAFTGSANQFEILAKTGTIFSLSIFINFTYWWVLRKYRASLMSVCSRTRRPYPYISRSIIVENGPEYQPATSSTILNIPSATPDIAPNSIPQMYPDFPSHTLRDYDGSPEKK